MSKEDLRKSFIYVLRSQGLKFKSYGNTWFIYKPKELLSNFLIKFNYIPKNVISNYLKKNYPNVKFQIFQNRLLLNTTYSNYFFIKNFINNLDSSYKLANINFLITAVNNNKARKLGVKLDFNNPFKNILLNIVTDTATISTLPSGVNFQSFINFLNSKNIAQTIDKPTLRLIDSHNYVLESVHSIPFTETSVTIDKNGNPVTKTDLKYKDIGLKIYIKNVFISKNSIDFDLDIYVQNIVSILQNNQPVVDTKHFNTHIQLTKKNCSYLIAGLRSVSTISQNKKVPVLGDLPFVGLLFRSSDKSVQDLSFSFYISTNYWKKAHCSPRSDAGAPQESE
ncbi:type II secretion system protein GspD [Caminibacter mediatlanticus]|uniref:Type II secretion pathway protein XcpQ n=1 Tax=Caminibacter mediatlanticus TB-2 TaxID=391592 RepID=A0AAI9AEU5_9BACT|nr:type II secretion pathway protein XcpQ [Caminibacter mediatlanticus]EDM22856.1 type II secretion pathway protein XcpQ [Caminibacter mediatlanticus TB-2]